MIIAGYFVRYARTLRMRLFVNRKHESFEIDSALIALALRRKRDEFHTSEGLKK